MTYCKLLLFYLFVLQLGYYIDVSFINRVCEEVILPEFHFKILKEGIQSARIGSHSLNEILHSGKSLIMDTYSLGLSPSSLLGIRLITMTILP